MNIRSPLPWLVKKTAAALPPEDRDAVLGDLAEAGTTPGQALRSVVGLVVRRQAEAWLEWQPWFALIGVAIPLGLVVSFVSQSWADGTAIHSFPYLYSWTPAYLESAGARSDLFQTIGAFVARAATLASWGWLYGLVLASLSRRASWLTVGVFGTLALLGAGWYPASHGPHNAEVFAEFFYATVFPYAIRIIFVLIPALFAMWRCRRGSDVPVVATGGAIAVSAIMALRNGDEIAWSLAGVLKVGVTDVSLVWLLTILPGLYVAAQIRRQRARV